MNKTTLKKCRACKSRKLIEVLSLGPIYLADFVNMDEKTKPDQYPLDLVLCQACHLVQLKHTIPPEVLYTERYGYKSGVSQTMREELAGITQKAERQAKLKPGDLVVDIGCNDGTLLKSYQPEGLLRVGFDPVAKFKRAFKNKGEIFINNYFSWTAFMKRFRQKRAKVITAIAMFYDVDDPSRFVADLAKILAPNGLLVIQQNYLTGMLEQDAFDNVVHEHLGYYCLFSLEPILNRYGLKVFDVEERSINGGSFRTYISHQSSQFKTRRTVRKMREKEEKLNLDQPQTYAAFARRVKSKCRKLYKLIKALNSRKKLVYVYGASTRGNTLLQVCGLDNRLIKAAVERNPEKWGKKIASVKIPIISEKQARQNKPDYMLALPWFFKPEFLAREKSYLEGGGKLIFPLPKLEIVESVCDVEIPE